MLTTRMPIGRLIDASTAFFVATDCPVSLKTAMHMISSLTVSWTSSA
jgi:hypothetical protein